MKTSEEILAELCDREAIRDLPVRYCDCVWQGNLETMLELFANDAVFITKGRKRESVNRGHDELRKMYEKAIGELSPRPFIHNHVVDLKGKTKASGRCYVELRNAKRQFEWVGTGFYDDEYVKEDGRWKFAARRFTSFGMQPAGAASGAAKS
jgi:hypothetical protein